MQSGTRMLGSSHAISRIMIGERWRCASRANLPPLVPHQSVSLTYKG